MNVIDSFDGEYYFLSNFSNYGFHYIDEFFYPTVEHFYQTHKVDKYNNQDCFEHYRNIILNDKNPASAKKVGRKVPIRDKLGTNKNFNYV